MGKRRLIYQRETADAIYSVHREADDLHLCTIEHKRTFRKFVSEPYVDAEVAKHECANWADMSIFEPGLSGDMEYFRDLLPPITPTAPWP